MSTIPLLGPAPISVGGSTLNPALDMCFACNPPYEHRRVWIPDGPRERTLVLCFDGTGDSFDQDNSNIVQLLAMMKKDDPKKQLVYYQAGIGTYTSNVVQMPIVESMSKLVDSMIAWNMPEHIKDGYQFLMQNYCVGDQICIFGFSRGAFTARALAGMLQKVGLLPPCNREQLPFAYKMYARDDEEGCRLSVQFKRTFSIDVRIKFLGVWDTVQSVGLIPKHLPFSGSNNAILHFRHALSLDERRVKFIPSFCTSGKPKHRKKGKDVSETGEVVHENGQHNGHHKREVSEGSFKYELEINTMTGPETDVEEVFFAGVHCDVGGGSVMNGTRNSLARVPLRWMIRECFKLNIGIIFDAHMLEHEIGLDIDSVSQAPEALSSANLHLANPSGAELQGFSFSHIPVAIISALGYPFRWGWKKLPDLHIRSTPQTVISLDRPRPIFTSNGEAREELVDALSPIYDQLKEHTYWKVMEWIPWIIKKAHAEVDGSDDIWAYKFIWNRGQGRRVYHQVMRRGMKVHRSVKTRMMARGMEGKNNKQYWPKIWCVVNGEIRRPTREEWLAEEPTFFEWVD